jgi:hypothetical protein
MKLVGCTWLSGTTINNADDTPEESKRFEVVLYQIVCQTKVWAS